MQQVDEDTLLEFQAALWTLPFATARMDLPWHKVVYMTDSSFGGPGVAAKGSSWNCTQLAIMSIQAPHRVLHAWFTSINA